MNKPTTLISAWRLQILGLSLMVFATLVGCQPRTLPPPPIDGPSLSVKHAWGETQVPLAPQRIVVLDLPYLDALTSLEQTVVGYAGTSQKSAPKYLVPYFKNGPTPLFVGERKQPNLELILSLNPQLIIANPDRHKLIRSSLETLAPTIAFQDNSLDECRAMILTLGQITQKQEAALALLQKLEKASLEAKIPACQGQTVILLGAFEDEFTTWTSQSFVASLFQEIGLRYAFTGPSSASESQTEVAKITLESLSELNPDWVFLYGSDELWLENPVYQNLQAFQSGRIHRVDRDLWSRSRGPLAALEILSLCQQSLKQGQP